MKPTASLSLDLDNKWSYMKTHGDAGWEKYPTYLDVIVPRSLEFLRARNLDITYFIVGQDAAREENYEAIKSISDARHEIGNHSFKHEPWLHLYSKQELSEEFEKTENALENVTGQHPKGFRGPGYSLSPTVLEVLAERGYDYDCSTLPTYIAPLARAYYFFKSPEMSAEEREKRKKLFGRLSDGFQSLKPYQWHIGAKSLIEIPGDDAADFQNADSFFVSSISGDFFRNGGENVFQNGVCVFALSINSRRLYCCIRSIFWMARTRRN